MSQDKEREAFEALLGDCQAELRRLSAVNAELLGAMKVVLNNNECLVGEKQARAAIQKAEEA